MATTGAMEARKDPVQRLLELLRLRTVSAEGPRGAYACVRGRLLATGGGAKQLTSDSLLPHSAPHGSARTWKRVRSSPDSPESKED
jgi:hypothetical protein